MYRSSIITIRVNYKVVFHQCNIRRQKRYIGALLARFEVIELFSCSTQLSMNFKVLIHTETAKINGKFGFKSQKLAIYPADKCLSIYEQDNFNLS